MALESVAGEDVDQPAPYPQEFRDDVVRVARNREPGQKLSVIAKDFGISESCLTNWMRQADVEDGARPGKTREESSELRDLRRRNRLLEQENEVLRRATAEYIDWFNHRRLHGEIGMIPPVELENIYHHEQTVPATADAALASL